MCGEENGRGTSDNVAAEEEGWDREAICVHVANCLQSISQHVIP